MAISEINKEFEERYDALLENSESYKAYNNLLTEKATATAAIESDRAAIEEARKAGKPSEVAALEQDIQKQEETVRQTDEMLRGIDCHHFISAEDNKQFLTDYAAECKKIQATEEAALLPALESAKAHFSGIAELNAGVAELYQYCQKKSGGITEDGPYINYDTVSRNVSALIDQLNQ